MLIKAFKLIKENILITSIFFLLYSIPSILALKTINEFNLYIFSLIMLSISTIMLFKIGYLYNLSETVKKRKTSIKVFLKGIKKFFIRNLLADLLLLVIFSGATLILIIILHQFSQGMLYNLSEKFGDILNNPHEVPIMLEALEASRKKMLVQFSIISLLFMRFINPFFALLIPSMYIEDNGVIESLKRGFIAGRKKYWSLVRYSLIVFLPFTIDILFKEVFFNFEPGNYISYIIYKMNIPSLAIIYLAILFVIYDQYKNEQVESPLQVIKERELPHW